MLKSDTDTDTDTLISEISILIPILILFKNRISIRYRYDTFGQKYRNFDTDTIVSKGSDVSRCKFPLEVRAIRYNNYGKPEEVTNLDAETILSTKHRTFTQNIIT